MDAKKELQTSNTILSEVDSIAVKSTKKMLEDPDQKEASGSQFTSSNKELASVRHQDLPKVSETKVSSQEYENKRKLPIENPKTALILVVNQIGYGNLAFAIKLAACIEKIGYKSSFLLGYASDEAALKTLKIEIPFVKEVPEDCAVCFVAVDFQISTGILTQLKEKTVPIFILSQYDHDDIGCSELEAIGAKRIKTGLAPDSKGIFIEEQLIINSDAERNLSAFKELTPLLREILLVGMDPSEYFTSSNLSLAYTSVAPPDDFAILHAHYHNLSKNKEKNYDLLLVTTRLNYDSFKKDVIKNVKDIYGKVTFIKLNGLNEKSTPGKESYVTSDNGREFRIFIAESIPHSDMLALHKIMGHDFCTITGDQSLSEAISRGCPFVYAYVFQSWKAKLLSCLIHHIPCLQAVINSIGKEDYENAAKILHENHENFIQFCEQVRNHRNLGSMITNYLQSQHFDLQRAPSGKTTKEHPEKESILQATSIAVKDPGSNNTPGTVAGTSMFGTFATRSSSGTDGSISGETLLKGEVEKKEKNSPENLTDISLESLLNKLCQHNQIKDLLQSVIKSKKYKDTTTFGKYLAQKALNTGIVKQDLPSILSTVNWERSWDKEYGLLMESKKHQKNTFWSTPLSSEPLELLLESLFTNDQIKHFLTSIFSIEKYKDSFIETYAEKALNKGLQQEDLFQLGKAINGDSWDADGDDESDYDLRNSVKGTEDANISNLNVT